MTDRRSPDVALADDASLPAVEAQAPPEVIAAVPASGVNLATGVVWDRREAIAAPVSHAAAPVAAMLAIPVQPVPALAPVDAAAASYDQAAGLAAASAAYEREQAETREHAAEAVSVTAAAEALATDQATVDKAAEDKAAEDKAAEDKAAADRATADKAAEEQKTVDDKATPDADAQRNAHDASPAVPPIAGIAVSPHDDAPIPTVDDAHPVAADDHIAPQPDPATNHAPAFAGEDHN